MRAVSPSPLEVPARPTRVLADDVISVGVADAQRISGLSKTTLYRLHRDGRLRMFRLGGKTLVDARELRALLVGAHGLGAMRGAPAPKGKNRRRG